MMEFLAKSCGFYDLKDATGNCINADIIAQSSVDLLVLGVHYKVKHIYV